MILVLGGTGEARALAAALDDAGVPVVSSLAGRVARPRLPRGAVRIGGFGGPEGLAAWLRAQRVGAVVDATHPFAARISASVARACPSVGVPLLRLERPGWTAGPGDDWHRVADLDAAAATAARLADRVFVTTGRQGLAAFSGARGFHLIRCVDPPDVALPADHELLLDRGPYTVAGEGALLDAHRIGVLVTKDSGGALTEAKLVAARQRGLPVVVVDRPARPGVPTVATADAALAWARAHHPG